MTEAELLSFLGPLPDNDVNLPFLADQMRSGVGVVPFVGAGLSAPYGYPLWDKFLRDVAKGEAVADEVEDHLKALEYEEAAGLLQARMKSRFQDRVQFYFGDKRLKDLTYRGAVTQVPHVTTGLVITTNFDRLLENVFDHCGCSFQVRAWQDKVDAVIGSASENSRMLLKLHGDWEFPSERVLTLAEYEKHYGSSKGKIDFELAIPQVLDQLVIRPMLFLGCSLKQDRTGSIIAQLAARKPRMRHYAIVEYPESPASFEQRRDELERMHIRPIWYPYKKHEKIEQVLQYLAVLLPEPLRLVKTAPAPAPKPDTIPRRDSTFIGRVKEKADLRGMVLERRLVTVVGAPGAGKTRLTTEVARTLEAEFEAIWFVPLSQLSDASAIPQRMSVIMQLQGQSKKELIDVVAAALKKGRQLLIFDNCETALKQCATIVRKLLNECPDLHILLTSRIDLGNAFEMGVENVYRVPPMELPDPENLPDLNTLKKIDSVELLLARVQARNRDFELTDADAEKVARLCRALDGIPLAVELVAAQIDGSSLESVLEQSAAWLDYSGVVAAGSQEHQVATLRKTIRLSYDLLGREQNGERVRLLFRSLGVFHRGWTVDAALAVCGETGETNNDMEGLLKLLRHVSLIEVEKGPRYRYLDPIREFALDELAAAGQKEALHNRHTRWAMEYAEAWSPKLLERETGSALAKLVGEADNLRGAIFWSRDAQDTETTLRITTALWRVFEIRAFYREGAARLRMALGLPGAEMFPVLQSKALGGLSIFAYRQGDLDTSERYSIDSLKLARAANYRAGVANALNDLGIVANSRGEYQKALDFYTESLKLEREENNQRGIAVGTYNCGRQSLNVGRLDDAERNLQSSFEMFNKAGNEREAAFALNSLSVLARFRGQEAAALHHVEESLKIRRKFEDQRGIAEALRTKAGILIAKRNFAEAQKLLGESSAIVTSIGDDRGAAETLEHMGWLARARELPDETVLLYAAAAEQRNKLHLPLPPVEQPMQDSNLDYARKALGEPAFAAQWEKGRWTAREEALRLGADRKREAAQAT